MKAIKVASDQWDYIEKNGRICVTSDSISVGEWVEIQYWTTPSACYTIELKVLDKIPLVDKRNDYLYELITSK